MIKLSGIVAGVILVGLAGYGVGIAAQQGGEAEGELRPLTPASAGRRPMPAEPSGTKPQQPPDIDGPTQFKGEGRGIALRSRLSNVPGEAEIVRILPGRIARSRKARCRLRAEFGRVDDQLVNQRIVIKTAGPPTPVPGSNREVAEIAVREYVEGDYVDQLAEVEGNIKIAEAELGWPKWKLKAEKSSNPGNSLIDHRRSEMALLRARFSLEKAQSARRLLVKYTRGKEDQATGIRGQEGPCRRAGQADGLLADDSEKDETWRSRSPARTIVAPMDGRVRYAFSAGGKNWVDPGFPVKPKAMLFTIEAPGQAAPNRDQVLPARAVLAGSCCSRRSVYEAERRFRIADSEGRKSSSPAVPSGIRAPCSAIHSSANGNPDPPPGFDPGRPWPNAPISAVSSSSQGPVPGRPSRFRADLPKIRDRSTGFPALLPTFRWPGRSPEEEAADVGWSFVRAVARHPDALRRGDRRRDDRPAAPRAVHAPSRSDRPKRPSRSWCGGTGRWCCGSAATCSRTGTMPRTPSRRPSSCWPGVAGRSTSGTRSRAGSSAWRAGWRRGRGSRRAAARRRAPRRRGGRVGPRHPRGRRRPIGWRSARSSRTRSSGCPRSTAPRWCSATGRA